MRGTVTLVRATGLRLGRAVAARPLDRTRVMRNNEGRICDSERGVSVFATPLMTLTTNLGPVHICLYFRACRLLTGTSSGRVESGGAFSSSPSLFSPSLFSPSFASQAQSEKRREKRIFRLNGAGWRAAASKLKPLRLSRAPTAQISAEL